MVPAERALTDSSRRRRARRRLRGRCTRGRHWPICAVPGRSSGRGRTSFGWGYCAPTITGLFARTFNLPNIICAMCDRSRNLARLAAACVCRQIFGGCRVTNRCCGGRRAGWSRVCCPRCVGLLVKKSSSTASTAAGAWASTAGAAVSTGGEKAFRRLFFYVDSWHSWERAFPLCRRCCCRRWMAEGAAARWAGPRPGMTCWREVAVCSHSVTSVLFWLAWWGADLPCRILCSTRWRLYCCGEKPTWRQ